MKFSELRQAFETYTGIIGEVDDADLAIWFNEAQLDLTPDFGPVKTVVLTPENGRADKPQGCLKVLSPCRENVRGQLVLDDATEIDYIGMPSVQFTETDQDQTPDLHNAAHYLLAIHATAMYWARESEGDTEEMNLSNYWLARYRLEKDRLRNVIGQPGSGSVDRWRIE